MSKFNLPSGIIVNSEHNGMLSVAEEHLQNLLKKDPLTNVYIVEHTPFARGKFAAVRRVTHRETGVAFAAKFIRKRRRALDARADILHEVAVLAALAGEQAAGQAAEHGVEGARVVALHGVYESAAEMALVLELAAGGELQRLLDDGDALPEAQARRLLRQTLQALAPLHALRVAHLDLKPQNILLSAAPPARAHVRLCDFGISRLVGAGAEVREILGTPDYVAPEVLSYEPISLATDIWSIGVLTYVLLTGFSPFGGDTKQETFLNISKCKLDFPEELFHNVSEEAQDFIRVTLNTNPKKRPSVEECLAHPWLHDAPESSGESISCSQEILVNGTEYNDNKISSAEGADANGNDSYEESVNHTRDVADEREDSDFDPLNIIRNLAQNFTESSCRTSAEVIVSNDHENDVILFPLKDEEESKISSLANVNEDFGTMINGHSKSEIASHFIMKTSAKHESAVGASGSDGEDDKDSPVNKRPKNCPAGRRSSFPVASCLSCAQCGSQCCHHSAPHSPDLRINQRHHTSINNSPVEITIDRGIIC